MSLLICVEANTKASSLSAAALNELLVRLDIQTKIWQQKKIHHIYEKRLLTNNIFVRMFSKVGTRKLGLTAKHHQFKLSCQ